MRINHSPTQNLPIKGTENLTSQKLYYSTSRCGLYLSVENRQKNNLLQVDDMVLLWELNILNKLLTLMVKYC